MSGVQTVTAHKAPKEPKAHKAPKALSKNDTEDVYQQAKRKAYEDEGYCGLDAASLYSKNRKELIHAACDGSCGLPHAPIKVRAQIGEWLKQAINETNEEIAADNAQQKSLPAASGGAPVAEATLAGWEALVADALEELQKQEEAEIVQDLYDEMYGYLDEFDEFVNSGPDPNEYKDFLRDVAETAGPQGLMDARDAAWKAAVAEATSVVVKATPVMSVAPAAPSPLRAGGAGAASVLSASPLGCEKIADWGDICA